MTNPKPQEIKGFVAVVAEVPVPQTFRETSSSCESAFFALWAEHLRPKIRPATLTLDTEKNDG